MLGLMSLKYHLMHQSARLFISLLIFIRPHTFCKAIFSIVLLRCHFFQQSQFFKSLHQGEKGAESARVQYILSINLVIERRKECLFCTNLWFICTQNACLICFITYKRDMNRLRRELTKAIKHVLLIETEVMQISKQFQSSLARNLQTKKSIH